MAARADAPAARQPGVAAGATNARPLEQVDGLREDLLLRDAQGDEPVVGVERRQMQRPSVLDESARAESDGEPGIREPPRQPPWLPFDLLRYELRDRTHVPLRSHRAVPTGLRSTVMLRPSKLSRPSSCPYCA